jgi:UDP-N-acetylglucosamine diphosphorylase / glucose-1-phosphate thymidylyltransferase / UDP-N-acetylgalactosamine diphosphorylase / glucosamine-1-phosphate N-acetyltransferase / galactosamine-1-phosphate N-acetyltransferase
MQTNIIKAVLLAAGRGTRMRDLTQELPKPMLAVRGKPVLQHIVEGLRDTGLTNLLVVVGWRADVVRDFFGDGSQFRVRIRYETQTVQDGTGRVVALARAFAGDDPFLLSYGDILVAPEIYSQICGALEGADAVLTVKRSDDVSQGGAVFLNDEFELTDLREKPKPGEPTSPWYNAGVYAFRPSIFDYIAKLRPSPRGEYELTDAIRDLALEGKKVQAIEIAGDWVDVRDPEILARLNAPL